MMSNLRQSIGLKAYAQLDPLVAYKREGHEAFEALLAQVRQDIVHAIFHVAPAQPNQQSSVQIGVPNPGAPAQRIAKVDTTKTTTVMSKAGTQTASSLVVSAPKKIGRNDPCYCGSGKKYKRCHGLAA
jgi:preprotein translocase subunit SecA